MTRNRDTYGEDADIFRPERFLEKDLPDPKKFIFGFGRRYIFFRFHSIVLIVLLRRICPGRYMAFSSLWMLIAAILATFEIAKSDETVLPEDGRYLTAGTFVLWVSSSSAYVSLMQNWTT